MTRSKWETVENLRKAGGDPDEIHKIPMKSRDPAEKAAPWKMYVWGPLVVVADETGHARYFAVSKEKENPQANKPAEVEAPAKTEPTPPTAETRPEAKKPERKNSQKKPRVKDDDEKDVFDK